jgi:plasmid stabilization system protein ParE
MRVTFDSAAKDELDDIFAWIAKDNPRAAYEMIARIEAKVMQLEIPQLAHMGRPGVIEGKVFEDRDEIVVLSVAHGARDREQE